MLNITSHQGNANLNHNETVNNTHLKFVESRSHVNCSYHDYQQQQKSSRPLPLRKQLKK